MRDKKNYYVCEPSFSRLTTGFYIIVLVDFFFLYFHLHIECMCLLPSQYHALSCDPQKFISPVEPRVEFLLLNNRYNSFDYKNNQTHCMRLITKPLGTAGTIHISSHIASGQVIKAIGGDQNSLLRVVLCAVYTEENRHHLCLSCSRYVADINLVRL